MKLEDLFNRSKKLDPAKLNELYKKQREQRGTLERRWREAIAFVEGDQYIYWDPFLKRVSRLPTEEGEKPRHRVRLTDNQLFNVVERLVAKMTSNSPVFEAVPRTTDQSDRNAAQLGKHLFEYLWNELYLGTKLDEALRWSIICGEGWWEVSWDSRARKPYQVTIDPNTGEPIINPGQLEAMKQIASAQGQELPTKTYYQGEISVEALSPHEVFLIGGHDTNQAHAAMKVKGYSPEFVKDRFGKEVKADGEADEGFTNLGNVDKKNDRKELVILKELWVKPTNAVPKGRYVAWAGDTVLAETDFPFAHGELPFHRFDGLRIPGRPYNISLIQQLISPQKALNRRFSQIIEYANIVNAPQWIAPVGSIQTPLTDEPNLVVQYIPHPAGDKPAPRAMPELQPWNFQLLNELKAAINDVSGQSEVSKGKAPANIEAGLALAFLSEQADSILGPRIKHMERVLASAGSQVLSLAKQFYTEPRLIKMTGVVGTVSAREFRGSDLDGCEAINVVPGSALPNSKAAQQDLVMKLMQQGVVPWQKGLRMMDFGGRDELLELWEQSKRRQQREIEAALRGDQVGEPAEWDEHEAHIEVLLKLFNSDEFESYPPEVAQALEAHYQAHKQMLPPPPPPENVRIQLQGRSDLTPTATSQLLGSSGIQVDPAQIAEEEDAREEAKDERELIKMGDQTTIDMAKAERENEMAMEQQQQQAELAAQQQAAQEQASGQQPSQGEQS